MPSAFPKMVPHLLTTAILLLVSISSTTTLASTLPKKASAHSVGGGEGNLRASTTATAHVRRQNIKQRRLGKSGKSSYYGKSGKAAYYDMDYSHHHHYHDEISYEDIPPHDHDAADIPYDTRGEKNLEVTMGGKLLTSNLNVMSDDDLTLLANAFDQTILHFLDDGYEADVYMIGAKSVGGGTESYVSAPSIDLFDRRRNRRILQSSSSSSDDDVLFNVRISKPCPDCTKETATVYGSQLFREAFGELMEKADSGELTATFCIFANAANVITEPCQVDIASVKGTSLKMGFKMDTGVPTPPDNLPIPMPTPQDHFPTYSPSTSVVEEGVPTYSPMATGGGIPTYAPTTSGDGMLTTAPSLPPATTSGIPTYAPTTGGASASPTLPSIGVTLAPATLPPGDTATPSTAPPAGSGDIPTYAPTTGGSTLAPVTLPPGTTATPSTAPPAGSGDVPTYAPTVGGSTLAPVTLPPGTTATPSTAPPASGTLLPVTLPPGTTATPSTVPPATGTTLAPVTLPPGTTATPSTLPPATGTLAPVTLPPGTTATPSTLPPATGTLAPVTLPPGTTATPSTLPPATSTLLPVTLPPGTTATPSTLPPATGSTLAPLTLPPGTTATPSTTLPALGTLSPASASTSAAPSLIPAGALYYDGFEQGSFLTATPEWTSQGDGLWELTTERANSGVYSIKSPALLVPDDYTQKTSNVTLLTNPAWPGGNLMFSILGGANMPFDDVIYYVDDVQIGQASEMTAFESREIPLEAGGHVITFSYKINPAGIDTFPPLPLDRIGAAFIDDVYFLPEGVTAPPSSSSIASRPPSSSIPGMSSVVPAPVSLSSNVPTIASVPSTAPPVALAATPLLFDGFETGDFTGLAWQITGEQAWLVDGTKPYEGAFSAHVRTEDITTNGNFSQLDLTVEPATAAFMQFYFYAPVILPFETLQLLVDDQFLVELTTTDEQWLQAGAMLSAGKHKVSWRLAKNPSVVPDDLLAGMEAPPFRIGEAWLDNVSLLPATAPFVEAFETGDFSQNAWLLTGDAQWSITDSNKHEGTYSATAKTDEIVADTGKSDLNIDIITEQGGLLGFQILASVSDPFDHVNVLIDDIAVLTYSTVSTEWLYQEVTIQPGKRKVTFQLVKNPGAVPPEAYAALPPVDGRLGQVWVDEIVFTPSLPARSFRLFSHHKSASDP